MSDGAISIVLLWLMEEGRFAWQMAFRLFLPPHFLWVAELVVNEKNK